MLNNVPTFELTAEKLCTDSCCILENQKKIVNMTFVKVIK